jgi:hypothetical protein
MVFIVDGNGGTLSVFCDIASECVFKPKTEKPTENPGEGEERECTEFRGGIGVANNLAHGGESNGRYRFPDLSPFSSSTAKSLYFSRVLMCLLTIQMVISKAAAISR